MRQIDTAELPPGMGLAVLRVVAAGARADAQGGDDLPADGMLLGGESVYTIRQPVTTLGRGLQNTVVLLDPAVSREHACIMREGATWSVENISAHNALRVGDRPVQPGQRATLVAGDVLLLGHTVLQFLAPSALEGTSGSGAAEPGPGTSSFDLLDPGITMRFALSGQIARRARWAILAATGLLFAVSALVTLGSTTLVGERALAAHGLASVVAALTVPLVPALGATLLVAAIDRYEREPVVLLAAAFAWGALIAIPAALVIERTLNSWLLGALIAGWSGPASAGTVAHSALLGLSAGFTEEAVKGAGLVVLLLLLRDEFDNVTDGILYGVLIGAGFAMVENFVYFAGSPRGDLGFLILGRVVLGWLGHSTFTALLGAGLGCARETRQRRLQLLAPLAGFAAAILLHSLFDFVDFQANAAVHGPHVTPAAVSLALAAVLVDYLPLFAAQAVLVWLLRRALRREAAIVREFLATEVPAGVVTPDEYAVLQKASLRARLERRYLFSWGPRAYLTARALHQTITGLAFRKWHVALGDRPKATPRQPEDAYRERIARLRQALLQLTREHTTAGIETPTRA
jgi:RsiW-degrading membrane proteinase PrsW (M82 family)